MYKCKKIKEFTPISKLEKLEILDVSCIFSNISFLEKNKNIEEINLNYCYNIKYRTIISKLIEKIFK